MVIKQVLKRLTTSMEELDLAQLRQFCADRPGVQSIRDVAPREAATVVGEVSSMRIVPRADGSSCIEATVTDGTASIVVTWTGRRRMAGIAPGKRLVVSGRGAPTGPGGRLRIYNPAYELLP